MGTPRCSVVDDGCSDLFSVDARFRWLRWHYRARDRPPRHRYLLICLYHRSVRRGGVVGGVHDHNTRPMSTTSVASEYFRYFTGIAIISFNMPYHTGAPRRSFRKYNLIEKRSCSSGMVRCSYWATTQSTVVWWWVLLLCFRHGGSVGRKKKALWRVMRDLNEMRWGRISFENVRTKFLCRLYEAILLYR